MLSPEQGIYGTIRRICHDAVDVDVYDYTPPAEAPYPFIRIGEQISTGKRITKQSTGGDTRVTIHFWHNNVYQRGTVSRMMHDVEQAIVEEFGARSDDMTSQIIEDNTTGSVLLHGILDIPVKNYEK